MHNRKKVCKSGEKDTNPTGRNIRDAEKSRLTLLFCHILPISTILLGFLMIIYVMVTVMEGQGFP